MSRLNHYHRVLLLALFFFALLPRLSVAALSVQEELKQGRICFDKKDYKGAIAHYNIVLSKEKDNKGALYIRGWSNFKNGQFDLAESDLRRLITLDPQYFEYPFSLAFFQIEGARAEQAIVTLENALKRIPNDPDLKYTLAKAYVYVGRVPEAQKIINSLAKAKFRHVKLNGSLESAFKEMVENAKELPVKKELDLGNACFNNDDYDGAITHFNAVLTIDKDHARALSRRGQSYRMIGNYEQAENDLQRVVKLYPKKVSYLYGLNLLKLQQFPGEKKVITAIEDSLKTFPDNPDLKSLLVVAYIRAGLGRQALEIYDSLKNSNFQFFNEDIPLEYSFSRGVKDSEDLPLAEEFIHLIDKSLNRKGLSDESKGWLFLSKAKLLFQLQEENQALEVCNKALTYKGEGRWEALVLKGQILSVMQNYTAAEASANEASKIKKNRYVDFVLFNSYLHRGLLKQAKKIYSEIDHINDEASIATLFFHATHPHPIMYSSAEIEYFRNMLEKSYPNEELADEFKYYSSNNFFRKEFIDKLILKNVLGNPSCIFKHNRIELIKNAYRRLAGLCGETGSPVHSVSAQFPAIADELRKLILTSLSTKSDLIKTTEKGHFSGGMSGGADPFKFNPFIELPIGFLPDHLDNTLFHEILHLLQLPTMTQHADSNQLGLVAFMDVIKNDVRAHGVRFFSPESKRY